MNPGYLRPCSADEALAMRATDGAVFVGGGTLVMGGLWPERPAVLVDLCDAGLDGFATVDGGLQIGAGMTIAGLLEALSDAIGRGQVDGDAFGALSDVLKRFSPAVVASVATVGGNLATGIGSLIGPLTLLAATASVRLMDGTLTSVPVAQAVAHQGLIVAVDVPAARDRSGYDVVQRTPAGPGLVSVALAQRNRGLDVVVAVPGSFPQRAAVSAEPLNTLAERVTAALDPIADDPRASGMYRRAMAGVLAARIAGRLGAEAAP